MARRRRHIEPTAKLLDIAQATPTPLARSRTARWSDLGWALVHGPGAGRFPGLHLRAFLRSIRLSFYVTDQAGESARFNGGQYYLRILNLDGSGRDEYLHSILTTFEFSLLVVPPGIAVAVALAVLAAAKMRGIQIFRTIFTSTVAISVASASVIWALIYNPSVKVTTWAGRPAQPQDARACCSTRPPRCRRWPS